MRFAVIVLGATACAAGSGTTDAGAAQAPATMPNTLTAEERASGFRLLFDGRSLAGWRGYDPATAQGWEVIDGELTRTGPGGDIVTVEEFANFELRLQWKISPGGNSGIFFRVTDGAEHTYEVGPEMQVLDDGRHADGASPLTSAGSNYALHPSPRGVVRAVGEWNDVAIVANGAHVEYRLNGVKVVDYELWSDEWERVVADSKFAQWPGYGRSPSGRIGLQDHGDRVAYRSIRIRELP